MLAFRCFLRSIASQMGKSQRCGGRKVGVAPYKSSQKSRGEANVGETRWTRAYGEKLDAFEPLTRNHSNQFHFTQKGDLGGDQPRG